MTIKIAISCGDPAGIGLEVTLKALSSHNLAQLARCVVYAAQSHWDDVVSAPWFSSWRLPSVHAQSPDQPIPDTPGISVCFLPGPKAPPRPGVWSDDWGLVAYTALETAIRTVQIGFADAIVTAPIHKQVLLLGPEHFPGQTELLAHRAGGVPVAMMLAGPRLRVVPITTHIALRDVASTLSIDQIVQTTLVTWTALKSNFGIQNPKLMMCGLNPHTGEDGRFGDEEQRILTPAVEALRDMGVSMTGPFAADSLFHFAVDGGADAVMCMYHDQGLIPLKLLHFHEGVNITLGLPFIRTSPDHGSAYDIAGRGLARPDSMIAALDTARLLVESSRAGYRSVEQ